MFQILSRWFDWDHKWHIKYFINGIISEASFTRQSEIGEFIQDTMRELRS